MTGQPSPTVGRRWLLTTATRASLAVAVFGTACRDGEPAASTPTASSETVEAGDLRWERADLGNVSAYVLVRAGEAAVVDTGNPGSADQIGAALQAAGVGWDAVGSVVLTHRHPDHVGSVEEVAARAPGATLFAGEQDVPAVGLDGVSPLVDGDRVFDLRVVATPGHTPGHVCVHDPATGLLVAGDAITSTDGSGIDGPNPDFTPDMATARQSVGVLAELEVTTVLFGHGAPYTGDDAGARLAELAAA